MKEGRDWDCLKTLKLSLNNTSLLLMV